ncbi:uncharacterized protein BXZ73DRAFT_99974 [Epithele typhae]|uniref:uncharacterized protein n=1 Tax=Epithele typhae TaxID=378194 RepID=UPI00200823A0|nr:uncharacterized protein BXZ73DRAFT_99974 [Epithele typhae]KAH9937752.1 hypothetical protein BXZ73DRAFT_99974 [Epithele typhae]
MFAATRSVVFVTLFGALALAAAVKRVDVARGTCYDARDNACGLTDSNTDHGIAFSREFENDSISTDDSNNGWSGFDGEGQNNGKAGAGEDR